MSSKKKNADQLAIDTLRLLSVDMVEKAKSGHPGMPLGAAPFVYALWSKYLNISPSNPEWFNRDRFILSAGHGCALLYSLLHLSGFNLSMDDLKSFRQWGSKTPGHPEYGRTQGVEAATGPLGQGFAMGVGMAIAERTLAGCFNKPGFPIVDHYTYVVVSDGDLMEGIASEAASLAGTLKLGKLIYLYDDNDISIEGSSSLAFTENVRERFDAYGWHTQAIKDGNDIKAVQSAIAAAQKVHDKPSIIIITTRIGYGSPMEGDAAVHGEPLGWDAVRKTKEFFGFDPGKSFYVPREVTANFDALKKKWAKKEKEWIKLFEKYKEQYPKEGKLFEKYMTGHINRNLKPNLLPFKVEDGPIATRTASGKVMNQIELYMTEFLGGSADLAPSTKTLLKGHGSFGIAGMCERNLHFGVREHAMGAIVNGMALHGGIIPYSATFLAFSDYMRPSIRLAAIMQTHSIFIFTHDSIGLGEDGPTHQPVEQLSSLRMIPGLTVIRPADANETLSAWYYAIVNKLPVVLVFSRQNLPVLDSTKYNVFEGVEKGGYALNDEQKPEIILIATGSEVHPALAAAEKLKEKKIRARVVSMPSYEIFMKQPQAYRDAVIPPKNKKRLIIEAGSTSFWRGLAGDEGDVLGVDTFGASAPGKIVMEKYGFTVENVVAKALSLINN
ncbi:MAG: transketolase [Spirochaetia bacterium]|nr:transketolase [Spirochaetia bacterium]